MDAIKKKMQAMKVFLALFLGSASLSRDIQGGEGQCLRQDGRLRRSNEDCKGGHTQHPNISNGKSSYCPGPSSKGRGRGGGVGRQGII